MTSLLGVTALLATLLSPPRVPLAHSASSGATTATYEAAAHLTMSRRDLRGSGWGKYHLALGINLITGDIAGEFLQASGKHIMSVWGFIDEFGCVSLNGPALPIAYSCPGV